MAQSQPIMVTVKGDWLHWYGIPAGSVLTIEERTEMVKGRLYVVEMGDRVDVGRLYREKGARRWWAELPAYNTVVRVTRRNLRGMVTRVLKKGMEL